MKRKFYFAKINIHGNIFSPNLEQLIQEEIPRVIRSVGDLPIGNSTLSFTDVDERTINGRSVIFGNVTKSKRTEQKVKSGSKTFLSLSEKELADTALFVYDLKNEILAFESTSKVPIDQFTDFFTRLLSQDLIVGKVIINLLPEEYKIIREIKMFDKIQFIKFQLIHPNPRTDHYNLYQKMINQTGAKKVEVTLKDIDDGLQIEINENEVTTPTIKDGIEMVESGYGEIEIGGEIHNEVIKKGRTKKSVRKKTFKSKLSHKQINFTEIELDKILKKVVQSIINVFD